MKTCFGTVFAGPHFNRRWSDLQQSFVERTTQGKWDLVCCLNREISSNINDRYQILDISNNPKPETFYQMSSDHCRSLSIILDHFHQKIKDYDLFVILDSDAFPIKKNWQSWILSRLETTKKSAAAVFRLENLSVFPHPCTMVFTKQALLEGWVNFKVEEKKDLLGNSIWDTCCGLSIENFYPLIRTNVWNPHPLFFGIYSHLFYHHGCGSRTTDFRSRYHYGKNNIISDQMIRQFRVELFQQPRKLIDKLIGKSH